MVEALFFYIIDIAVVNSFIIFKQHQVEHPEIEDLQRPRNYALVDYKEELVRHFVRLNVVSLSMMFLL